MPIYEYIYNKDSKKDPKKEYKGCEYCIEPFEVLVLKKEDELNRCPKCESPLEKIISQNTFHLKDGGVGWESECYSGTASKKDSKK